MSLTTEQREALRMEADQQDLNAWILLSAARISTYEDAQRAANETDRAKDTLALADLLYASGRKS